VIRQILITLYLFINVACMIITGIHIARENDIGPGLVIHNFCGILVLAKKIGHSCTLNQGVSIMNVRGIGRATIGNNCYFGAGCKVVGAVTIGDNVVISPNSLVIADVPSGATVLGVPARVISREATSAYLKHPIMPVSPEATKDSKPANPVPSSTSGVASATSLLDRAPEKAATRSRWWRPVLFQPIMARLRVFGKCLTRSWIWGT